MFIFSRITGLHMMGSTVIPFLVESIQNLKNIEFYKSQLGVSEKFLNEHKHYLAINMTNNKSD